MTNEISYQTTSQRIRPDMIEGMFVGFAGAGLRNRAALRTARQPQAD